MKQVVISVLGGVAEVEVTPEGVEVEIVDLDDLKDTIGRVGAEEQLAAKIKQAEEANRQAVLTDQALDPVHSMHRKADGTASWYFWDETWTHCYGPFPDENAARTKYAEYCKYLDKH